MHNVFTIYVFCYLYKFRFLINVPLLFSKVPQKVGLRWVIQTYAWLREKDDMMTLKQRLAELCMRHLLKFKEICFVSYFVLYFLYPVHAELLKICCVSLHGLIYTHADLLYALNVFWWLVCCLIHISSLMQTKINQFVFIHGYPVSLCLSWFMAVNMWFHFIYVNEIFGSYS